MGRRRKKGPAFVLGEEQEFPALADEEGFEAAYVQIGSVRITNHGLSRSRRSTPGSKTETRSTHRSHPSIPGRKGSSRQQRTPLAGLPKYSNVDGEHESDSDDDDDHNNDDGALADYLENITARPYAAGARSRPKLGGSGGDIRKKRSYSGQADEMEEDSSEAEEEQEDDDHEGKEEEHEDEEGEQEDEEEAMGEDEDGEEEEDMRSDNAMLRRLLRGFAGRDIDPDGLGDTDNYDEDEDEDEEGHQDSDFEALVGGPSNLYEALLASEDSSDEDDDVGPSTSSGGGGYGHQAGPHRHRSLSYRQTGRTATAGTPPASKTTVYYYEYFFGPDGKEHVRVVAAAAATLTVTTSQQPGSTLTDTRGVKGDHAGRRRSEGGVSGNDENIEMAEAEATEAPDVAAGAGGSRGAGTAGGNGGLAVVLQQQEKARARRRTGDGGEGEGEGSPGAVRVDRFPFVMRTREQVRAAAADVMAASASGGVTPVAPRSTRCRSRGQQQPQDVAGVSGGGRGRPGVKGALQGALRPGEKKQLRKERIQAKRAAREATRGDGFDVARLVTQISDFVSGEGDVLALDPLGRRGTALAQSLAGVYGLRHSLQGSGNKKFLLLQPTDRTKAPDTKTQAKVDKLVSQEVGRQQLGAAAGAGVGPAGMALQDSTTPAAVAATRRGGRRGGGGGGRTPQSAGRGRGSGQGGSGGYSQPVAFVRHGLQRYDGEEDAAGKKGPARRVEEGSAGEAAAAAGRVERADGGGCEVSKDVHTGSKPQGGAEGGGVNMTDGLDGSDAAREGPRGAVEVASLGVVEERGGSTWTWGQQGAATEEMEKEEEGGRKGDEDVIMELGEVVDAGREGGDGGAGDCEDLERTRRAEEQEGMQEEEGDVGGAGIDAVDEEEDAGCGHVGLGLMDAQREWLAAAFGGLGFRSQSAALRDDEAYGGDHMDRPGSGDEMLPEECGPAQDGGSGRDIALAAALGSAEGGGSGGTETAAGDRQVLVSEEGVPYFRAHFRLGPSYDVEEGRAESSGGTTAAAWAAPSEWALQAAGLGRVRRGLAPPPAGEVEAAAAVSGRVTEEAEVEEMKTEDGRDGGGEWLVDKRPRGRSKKAAAKDGGGGGKGGKGGGEARQPRRGTAAASGADDVPGGSGAGRPAAALPGELGMTYQQAKAANKKAAKEARRQERRHHPQQPPLPAVPVIPGAVTSSQAAVMGGPWVGVPTADPGSTSLDYASFERHGTGIGSRLMGRMGWSQGDGLGRARQGRSEPLRAFVRPRSLGLGADG